MRAPAPVHPPRVRRGPRMPGLRCAGALVCAAALLLAAPAPPTHALMAPAPMAPAPMSPAPMSPAPKSPAQAGAAWGRVPASGLVTASSPVPAIGSGAPSRFAVPAALPPDAEAILAAEHGTWRWPMSSRPVVVNDFRPPAKRWLSGHRGVDLTVGLSGEIRAPADGRVSHVGTVVDRQTITLDHGRGLRSSFEPVASELRKGDRVRRGEVIGVLSARDHCRVTLRACVHWGVRLGDEYVHPLPFVGAQRPSVLLPVPG